MSDTVLFKTYPPPPVDKKEILRYAGVRGDLPEVEPLLLECIKEISDELKYCICYAEFPVSIRDGLTDIGFAEVRSASLAKNLCGCDRIVVFAATVGIGPDRLIARYGRIAPTKSLLFQAIGTERIESLCDAFSAELAQNAALESKFLRPRFSPGYGDVPLDLQKDIFRILDCPRKLGLTLNDSLLMSPSKSVTAIVGIGDTDHSDRSDCTLCGKTDCLYRS